MNIDPVTRGKHPAWGVLLLVLLIWHVSDTMFNLNPQYMFFRLLLRKPDVSILP